MRVLPSTGKHVASKLVLIVLFGACLLHLESLVRVVLRFPLAPGVRRLEPSSAGCLTVNQGRCFGWRVVRNRSDFVGQGLLRPRSRVMQVRALSVSVLSTVPRTRSSVTQAWLTSILGRQRPHPRRLVDRSGRSLLNCQLPKPTSVRFSSLAAPSWRAPLATQLGRDSRPSLPRSSSCGAPSSA